MKETHTLRCWDVAYNNALLFQEYYAASKLDSAEMVLSNWNYWCGGTEPVRRAKIILALRKDQYNDSLLSNGMLDYIRQYQTRMVKDQERNYAGNEYRFGYLIPGKEFDTFTKAAANLLKQKYPEYSVERLLCEFYSTEDYPINEKLDSEKYPDNSLSAERRKKLSDYNEDLFFHIAALGGVWIPNGRLKPLGIHPMFGIEGGFRGNKLTVDMIINLAFLNSKNFYLAKNRIANDTMQLTDRFFLGHIGFASDYVLYARRKHEFGVVGGIALEGWDPFYYPENDNDNETKLVTSVRSYNFNFGLSYKLKLRRGYIGLEAKYNIVDYTLSRIVRFTGNPVTIQITYGNWPGNYSQRYYDYLHRDYQKEL